MNDIIEQALLARTNFLIDTGRLPTHIYLGHDESLQLKRLLSEHAMKRGEISQLGVGQAAELLGMEVVIVARPDHLCCGYYAGSSGFVDAGGKKLVLSVEMVEAENEIPNRG